MRVVRAVVVDRAVSTHTHEMREIAGTRGTEPPKNGCTCRAVIVFDLAVSGAVIRILRLFAGFVCVCVIGIPEYFALRQQKDSPL